MTFEQAERVGMRLLMALLGPAGSGKTVTALKIMSYLTEGEDIFLIDSENRRSLQYTPAAGEEVDFEKRKFRFKVAVLDSYSPVAYTDAIKSAVKAGAKGIIVDSLSHAWAGKNGVLEQKNKLDAAGGNGYVNWGKLTPLQNELMDTIMGLPIHIICTMRTKMGYEIVKNESGKNEVHKLGLEPVQRDDVEYNFDIVGMGNQDHVFHFREKDTSGLLETEEWVKPGRDLVERLLPWLNTGTRLPLSRVEFIQQMNVLGFENNAQIATFVNEHPEATGIFKFDTLLEIARAG